MASRQNASNFDEKRRYNRINALNGVSFFLFDADRKKIAQGNGRTLNLSQKGLLLETRKPLNGAYVVLVAKDLNDQPIQVKGRVVDTRKSEKAGFFLTGVEFLGSREKQKNAIIAFVKTHNHRKTNNGL